MSKSASAVLTAAVLALAPAAALAQIPQPSPAGKAPAPPAAPQKLTCPPSIPATVTTPAGYSRIDQNGAELKLTLVTVDGGQLICRYGSFFYTIPTAKNCTKSTGFWNPDGNCYPVPAGVIVGSDPTCYVSCL